MENAASFNRPAATTPAGMAVARNTDQGVQVGNELLAGLGLSFGIVPEKFDLVGEVYSFTGLGDNTKLPGGDKQEPGMEAIAGIKLYLARNSFFELGGG